MTMLKTPGLLVIVVLKILFVTPGYSDVVITIRAEIFWVPVIHHVTFSLEHFNEFYNCLCNNRKTCTANYFGNNVYNVESGQNSDSKSSECVKLLYHCRYKSLLKITCEKSSSSDIGNNPKAFHSPDSQCRNSCVVLIWSHSVEKIDFSNSGINAQDCYNDCVVSGITTEAVTTKTATITTPHPKTIPTGPAVTPTTETLPNRDSDSNPPLGIIIGVVSAVVVITIIIALVAFIVWRRKQKRNVSKPQSDSNIAALAETNNSESSPQDGVTETQIDFSYSVASSSPDHSHLHAHNADEPNNNDKENAKALKENSFNEARASSAFCESGSMEVRKNLSETEFTKNRSPYDLASQNNTDKSQAGNGEEQIELYSIKDQRGTGISTSHVGEYAYSTVHDQNKANDNHESASVLQCDSAVSINSHSRDPGYEYAGPDYSYSTETTNKSSNLNKVNDSMYSVAVEINNPTTTGHAKHVYSRLHEENRKEHNPYNTLLQPSGDTPDSSTATGSLADQSKNVYSKLHEDNRQIQNPYNTLLQPTEGDTSNTPLSGHTHNTQTANQPSHYSFAQPTSCGMSNENTDDNSEINDVVTSQNHTYHILEATGDQGSDDGKESNNITDKKRNIYFELEKEEDVSNSDTCT